MSVKTAKPAGRRSGRIKRELPIQVSGIDAMGHDFTAPARTLMLSRYGAEIVLKNELVPEQELSIALLGNAQDWDARVVGLFSKDPEGYSYGVEFLFQDANFWGITFPPMPGSPDSDDTQKTSTAAGAPRAAEPLSEDIDFDDLWKKARKASPTHNYAVRLKCPHAESHGGGREEPFGDEDQWLILQSRQETLQQVLEIAWDFACPIHGAQREYPLEAKETQPGMRIVLQQEPPKGIPVAKTSDRSAQPRPRREHRTPQTVRVWVRGMDWHGNTFRQSAYSVDISRGGARLEGLGLITWPGTTIEVKRHWRRALFRVVWTGRKGTPQASQIGISCLEPSKNVWGISEDN